MRITRLQWSLLALLVGALGIGITLAQSGPKADSRSDTGTDQDRAASQADSSSQQADAGRQARDILTDASRPVRDAEAFEVTAEMTVAMANNPGREQRMRYRVALARPDRVLVEPIGRGMGMLAADGERLKAFHSRSIGFVAEDQPDNLDEVLSHDLVGVVSQGAATFPLILGHSRAVEQFERVTESIAYVGTAERDGTTYDRLTVSFPSGPAFDMFFTAGAQPMLAEVVAEVNNMVMTIDYDWSLGEQLPKDRFALRAPDFTLKNMAGEDVPLSKHRGEDVVVLDFWATWCAPCVEAMPIIDRVVSRMREEGKNVVLYAVNQAEGKDKIARFLEQQELDVNVLRDEDGTVAGKYWVTGIPQTVIINPEGEVEMIHVGFGPNLERTLTRELSMVLNDEPIMQSPPQPRSPN